MRVLVHPENGHPMRRIIAETEAPVGVPDGIGKRSAAGNNDDTLMARNLRDCGQYAIEMLDVFEESSADFDHEIDRRLVVSGFSRTANVGADADARAPTWWTTCPCARPIR